jgi:L-alanine-DL-glutamate epimerase-like enolase superfamily enzyme
LNAVPGLIPGYTVKEGFALPNDATGLGFDIDWQKFEAAVTWA